LPASVLTESLNDAQPLQQLSKQAKKVQIIAFFWTIAAQRQPCVAVSKAAKYQQLFAQL